MPPIGAGDQGYAPDQVMASILRAAVAWFRRGLPMSVLETVAYSDDAAAIAKKKFLELERTDAAEGSRELTSPGSSEAVPDGAASSGCDIFLNCSHEDSEPAWSC
jgi:hypothetical protein